MKNILIRIFVCSLQGHSWTSKSMRREPVIIRKNATDKEAIEDYQNYNRIYCQRCNYHPK